MLNALPEIRQSPDFKQIPVDLVATWQPERERLLPRFHDLAALVAVVAFSGLIGSVAILFA